MNLLQLLTPAYLFEPYPGSTFSYGLPLYLFFAVVIILSFFVAKYLNSRPLRKLESRFLGAIPNRMRELSVLGLLFTFTRDQNVPYFGMRAGIVLIFLLALAYAIYTWRNYKKNFPLVMALSKNKKVEDKYIPKPKKRK